MKGVENIIFQGQTAVLWRIGISTFIALPEHGARLLRWEMKMPDANIRQVIYWPEKTDWNNFKDIRGGNPILFPFAGRSSVGETKLAWKNGRGQILPMPQHGFASDGKFELIELNKDGFVSRFIPNELTKESYPFKYDFTIRYTFSELQFDVTLVLENRETGESIPWAPGHHFYFTLPWHNGLGRKDYRINIPCKKACRHGEGGKLIPLKNQKIETDFSDPGLWNRIHYRFTDNKVVFGPKSEEENIAIVMNLGGSMNQHSSLVTWTENEKSPFYCVEPWLGLPNAAEHQKGLHFVNPGEAEYWTNRVSLME